MPKYIDREALLQEISKQKAASKHSFPRRFFVVGDVLACIRTAPDADVAPVVHGKWMKQNCQGDYGLCSECNCRIPWIPKNYKYCPKCGAKMEEFK